jgi:tRNA(fMet)-specific endonuclease VapC
VALTRICVDTSAYSYFKRGDRAAVEALTTARSVGVPAVVLGELRTGFRLGVRPERNEAELRAFLAEPVVQVLDVDDDAATLYAEIVAELRGAGTPLSTNDVWIAAVALREAATIVTFDAHFRAIRRVGALVLRST